MTHEKTSRAELIAPTERRAMPFLPTRTMAVIPVVLRVHATAVPPRLSWIIKPKLSHPRPLVFGYDGPTPSGLLSHCGVRKRSLMRAPPPNRSRSSESSPLITDHRLTTRHILTRWWDAIDTTSIAVRCAASPLTRSTARSKLQSETASQSKLQSKRNWNPTETATSAICNPSAAVTSQRVQRAR